MKKTGREHIEKEFLELHTPRGLCRHIWSTAGLPPAQRARTWTRARTYDAMFKEERIPLGSLEFRGLPCLASPPASGVPSAAVVTAYSRPSRDVESIIFEIKKSL